MRNAAQVRRTIWLQRTRLLTAWVATVATMARS